MKKASAESNSQHSAEAIHEPVRKASFIASFHVTS
jgi:hypothetical protein